MSKFLSIALLCVLCGVSGVCQPVIGPAVFTGAGLNDGTSGGSAITQKNLAFSVIVDGVASPNRFKWNVNGGSFTTGVAMTGAPQTLSSGVTIKFAAATGHTLADKWTISVTIRGTLHVQTSVQSGAGAMPRRGDDKANDVIDIRDFGAVCDGSTDDQAAITFAVNQANAAGGGIVWIPRTVAGGTCKHSSTITVASGVSLDGNGTLQGTTFANQAVILTGTGSGIRNVSMISPAVVRLTNNESVAVWMDSCVQCEMRGVRIDGSPSAGTIVTGSTHGVISDNRIRNTLADSITITGVSSDISVIGNVMFNSGDDCVSVNSYIADGARSTDIAVSGNTCVNGKARAFTTNGGQRVNFTGNVASNIFAHGLLCAQDATFMTYTPIDCSFASNVVVNTDNTRTGNFAGITVVQASGVTITDNYLSDGPGIVITGDPGQNSDHVYIHGNHLHNILEKQAIRNSTGNTITFLQVDNNTVDTAESACIVFTQITTGMISGNSCNNVDTVGDPPQGVLELTSSTNVAISWNRIGTFGPALIDINVPPGQAGVLLWAFDPLFTWDYVNKTLLVGPGAIFVSGYNETLTGGGLIITDNHNIAGSGSSAKLNLFSGEFTGTAEAAVILDFNSLGTSPSSVFTVQSNGGNLLGVNISGLVCAGNVLIGSCLGTFIGHYDASDGSPGLNAPTGGGCPSIVKDGLTIALGASTCNPSALVAGSILALDPLNPPSSTLISFLTGVSASTGSCVDSVDFVGHTVTTIPCSVFIGTTSSSHTVVTAVPTVSHTISFGFVMN